MSVITERSAAMSRLTTSVTLSRLRRASPGLGLVGQRATDGRQGVADAREVLHHAVVQVAGDAPALEGRRGDGVPQQRRPLGAGVVDPVGHRQGQRQQDEEEQRGAPQGDGQQGAQLGPRLGLQPRDRHVELEQQRLAGAVDEAEVDLGHVLTGRLSYSFSARSSEVNSAVSPASSAARHPAARGGSAGR